MRRSSRQSVPTLRGKQYRDERNHGPPLFPSTGDDIHVKWIVRGKDIWWQATVVSIQASSGRECAGTLLYHKRRNYAPVESVVTFSYSNSHPPQRFVTDAGSLSSNPDPSSWCFPDELPSNDEGQDVHAPTRATATPTRLKPPRSAAKSSIRRNVPIQMHKSTRNSRVLHLRGRSVLPGALEPTISKRTITGQRQTDNSSEDLENAKIEPLPFKSEIVESEPGTSAENEDEVSDDVATVPNFPPTVEPTEVNEDGRKAEVSDQFSLDVRLRLLERQVLHSKPSNSANLSATAYSVIVSLKWAMLRALEKPLRNIQLDGLAENGLAANELVITSQCDYHTFRELAAVIAKEHQCGEDGSRSRVAFSPSFPTTQAGSSASDNLNILFTCLADVTSFLLIRDDNDFESILSKEVVTEASTLLRILGTFSINDPHDHDEVDAGNEIRSGGASTNFTEGTSASSDKSSVISLFIGSASVNYKRAIVKVENNGGATAQHLNFRSSLLQQECRYFCTSQKCYRTPWSLSNIETNYFVNCPFHLDGTAPKEQLKKFFLLTWTRHPSPSAMKWTRDIHDVGNNLPGSLRLSIPYVFFTTSRNVRTLVSLLDTQIETFMRVRSKIHNSSSFK